MYQSRVKALRYASVVRLKKVPRFSVLVVNRDKPYCGRAFTDVNTASRCATDTIWYNVYLGKVTCSLSDGLELQTHAFAATVY